MSTVEKTEAVVLKSMPYLETSKIVTFYTRRFGRLATIVKGARRPANKYGSSLEPMSHDLIVVYRKEGRELQTLSQCDSLHSSRALHEDLEKMSAGMAMIELISLVARDEEENAPLFSLLTDSLAAVGDATKNPSIVLYWFEVRLAGILGFRPAFDVCASCGTSLAENGPESGQRRFHLEKGGPLCQACSAEPGHSVMLGPGILAVLQKLSRLSSARDSASVDPGEKLGPRIGDFVRMYLAYHVHGLRPLKSDRVFSRILG